MMFESLILFKCERNKIKNNKNENERKIFIEEQKTKKWILKILEGKGAFFKYIILWTFKMDLSFDKVSSDVENNTLTLNLM